MRRIARFLDIEIQKSVWPDLIEAAGFEAMKNQGLELLPGAERSWEGGADRFLFKGTNDRWQDVVTDNDLRVYDAKVMEEFSPALARWLEHGRLKAGDPEKTAI